MKLYEINTEIEKCVIMDGEVIDGETGEILDKEYLDNLVMERKDKITNLAKWTINLASDEDALDNEIKRLQDKKKSVKNKRESIEKYLSYVVGDDEKVTDGIISVSKRRSESVEVNLESFRKWADADKYLKYDEPKPIKAELKKLLKGGNNIPGCELKEKYNLQVK